jgi:hypothetical protein
MSVPDRDYAQQLLSEFIGCQLSYVEYDEFQLRLIFENKSEFVTTSPWRLFLKDSLILGSGDIKRGQPEEIFDKLKELRVESVVISDYGDTRFLFDHNSSVEAIADSVRYETWEAHTDSGWVVFNAGGSTTLFRPSAALPNPADGSSGAA